MPGKKHNKILADTSSFLLNFLNIPFSISDIRNNSETIVEIKYTRIKTTTPTKPPFLPISTIRNIIMMVMMITYRGLTFFIISLSSYVDYKIRELSQELLIIHRYVSKEKLLIELIIPCPECQLFINFLRETLFFQFFLTYSIS